MYSLITTNNKQLEWCEISCCVHWNSGNLHLKANEFKWESFNSLTHWMRFTDSNTESLNKRGVNLSPDGKDSLIQIQTWENNKIIWRNGPWLCLRKIYWCNYWLSGQVIRWLKHWLRVGWISVMTKRIHWLKDWFTEQEWCKASLIHWYKHWLTKQDIISVMSPRIHWVLHWFTEQREKWTLLTSKRCTDLNADWLNKREPTFFQVLKDSLTQMLIS